MPLVDEVHHVVHVDGIHLHRDAVVLIAVAGGHVIGWHVAKSEKAAAWQCLMARIAPPDVLVCDGGGGVLKAAKATWPDTRIQRCLFHVQANILELTGRRPRLEAGGRLRRVALSLPRVGDAGGAAEWLVSYNQWEQDFASFLDEKSEYADGGVNDMHQRLVKARRMIRRRIREGHLFTFLDEGARVRRPGAVHQQPRRIMERAPARHAAPPPRTAAGQTAEGDLLVVPPAHGTSRDRRVARGQRDDRRTTRAPLPAGMGKEPARPVRDVRHPRKIRHRHRLERVPHTGRMAVERLDRRTHILAYNPGSSRLKSDFPAHEST